MSDLILWEPGKSITMANYKKASEIAVQIKTAQKDIEAKMADAIKAAHASHRMIKSVMDTELSIYKGQEVFIKESLAAFHKKNPGIEIDKVKFTDSYKPVIVDESIIPEEYLKKVPDLDKIKEAVSKQGKLFKCDGIIAQQTTMVSISGD